MPRRSATRSCSGTGRDCCDSSSRVEIMTELFGVSAPTSPASHLVHSGTGRHLFVPNGSRLYDIDEATWDLVRGLESAGDERELTGLLARLGVDAPPYVDDT